MCKSVAFMKVSVARQFHVSKGVSIFPVNLLVGPWPWSARFFTYIFPATLAYSKHAGALSVS